MEEVDGAAHDFRVHVPSSRASKDITIERDLVEEVGRIHRYGNIPERAMTFEIAPPPRDERRLLVRRIQDRLAGGARFHEVLSYSFVEDALLARLGQAELPYVRVINPVVQGQDKVRRSVLPSLLADLEKNRRERDDVRLFEIGKGYLPEHANERGEPAERHLLALVWAGRPPARKAAFEAGRLRQLQGVLTDLSDHLGLARLQWSRDPQPASWAHPGKALVAGFEGQAGPALCLAELEPGVARALGLREDLASDVAAAEVDLDRLLAAPLRARRYQPIPRFPGTKLDVAVSLPEATPASAVESAIEKAGKGLVARSELFDLYRGDNIGAGRKSLAYHLLLQSESRTLGEQDEQKFLKRFEQLLAEIGAELRRG